MSVLPPRPADPAPADPLDRIFHEPARLAIASELARHPDGVLFRALRDACSLTDGNLNRHLKQMEDARVVAVRKRFVERKPQTRILLTDSGAAAFVLYLQRLQEVLARAKKSAGK